VNAQEAADILAINRRRNGDLREMLRALTLYPWLNTMKSAARCAVGANALARVPGRMRSAPRGAPHWSPVGRCSTPTAVRTCGRKFGPNNET
jgi:hypothetical protein